jgi:hypothetical protein
LSESASYVADITASLRQESNYMIYGKLSIRSAENFLSFKVMFLIVFFQIIMKITVMVFDKIYYSDKIDS